jgi:light-regulated signal transduction histidine kinase (bacteriophytochrome)
MTALDPLVGEVVEEVKLDLQDREIEWRIGPLPTVQCDPDLVRQVFINLLANAAKYTRPRQRAVIAVDQITTNGTPVFFVKDNGVGFDMKYADKLFGVFQRLHRAEDFEDYPSTSKS